MSLFCLLRDLELPWRGSRSRPYELPKRGLTVAKPWAGLFDWKEKSALLLIALGAVFVIAFVFLDLRASTLMNLFGS